MTSVFFDPEAIAKAVVEQIVELIGDTCVLWLRTRDEKRFEIVATHHVNPEAKLLLDQVLTVHDWSTILEKSVSGTGQVVLIPHIQLEHMNAFLTAEHHLYVEQFGFHSLLIVPMRVGGKIIGTVSISRDSPEHPYTTDDGSFLQELTDRAGLAIQNARLFEEVKTGREQMQHLARQVISAQEEERRRIARELHDESGQSLTALKASLQMTHAAIPSELEAVRHSIMQNIELATMTLEHIRLLAHNLRPPILDFVELVPVLQSCCREFAQHTGHVIDFHETELPALPDDIEILLYRFLQEALTNIAKHAQATHVIVSLNITSSMITLNVEDNGRGFQSDTASRNTYGIGLTGLRERLMPVGGWLEITSVPEQGSRLTAHVPWEPL